MAWNLVSYKYLFELSSLSGTDEAKINESESNHLVSSLDYVTY